MTVLDSVQLDLIRTRPQHTKLWLSIYKPQTVLACRVNDVAIDIGAMSITYDGVTSGSYVSIQSGMVMLVGTTLGGSEKGRIRVRSATSSVITVAENSHINWGDDDYLTILNYYEITAIYPRIILDPADNTKTIWYKDYDVQYTNQNDILGAFICMGSHYAGFVGDQVFYSASGTTHVFGESLSYNWWFDGATVTGSSVNTPGFITYNTPGHYTTRLIVSGTASSDVSYRHISIYNRPESGANTPILRWEMSELSGQREAGGYTAKIRVYDDVSSIVDNALVVIFSENWYGEYKQSDGSITYTQAERTSDALNRNTILFSGYIVKGSIEYNYRDKYVDFDIGSPAEIMKNLEGFSVAVNNSANPSSDTNPDIPSKWVLVKDLNMKRGIYHYLRWHSTVLMCNDFEYRGLDLPIEYFDSDRTSLFDAVHTFMYGTMLGDLVCDRHGKMWAEVGAEVTDNSSSAFPTSLIISKQDWIGEPSIDERTVPEVSFIEMGGVAYSGTGTSTSVPYLSAVPGNAPGYGGKNESIQGLALVSQAHLNILAGNYYAYRNSRFPNVGLSMASNFNNLDIAPVELVRMNVAQTDTVRGITWSNKPFVLSELSWLFDPKNQVLLPSINISEVTQGYPGTSIAIPPIPPTNTDGGGGVYIPPINIPDLGTITINTISNFNWSFVMNGGTGTFSTGIAGMIEVPFNCRITSAKLVATASGNIVIDLWKCAYASINPGTHPVVGDSIIGAGAKPTLSTAYKTNTDISGWTTVNLVVGDWLYIIIDSNDLSLVTLSISGLVGL